MSKDAECLQEAEKLVRWSLEHVSKIREDESYSIELSTVESYSNDNLSKITERAYNYDKFECLRQEVANMSDIIAQSVADYLCGFRIRVNNYEEWRDGKYSAVSDIANWFQMVYGKESSSMDECQTVDYLLWFFDTPIHGAWNTYMPSIDAVKNLKKALMKPVRELISVYNKHSNEVTSEYLMKDYDGKTNDELLSDIRRLTRDAEFSNTDHDIMYMSYYLLKYNMYEDWVSAFEHLHYPILQGQMLNEISLPDDCFSIVKVMENSTEPRKIVNQALVRQRWFETICKVTENLRDDRSSEHVAEELKAATKAKYDEWQNSLPDRAKDLLELSRDIFGAEDTVKWITSLPYFESDKEYLGCRINNEIIDMMANYCSDSFPIEEMGVGGDSLDYLLFLLTNAINSKTKNQDRIKEVLVSLFDCIYRAKYFVQGVKLSNDELSILTTLCEGLAMVDNSLRETLFAMFDIKFEGYEANEEACRNAELNKHAFTLSAKLLLSLQENSFPGGVEASEYFKSVVGEVVKNYQFIAHRNIDNTYRYPLSVAMLIASQRLSLGEWFANIVIEDIDNLVDVLSILMQGKDSLSDNNISRLQCRKETEWPLWEIVYKDTSRRNNITICEDLMKKLNLK